MPSVTYLSTVAQRVTLVQEPQASTADVSPTGLAAHVQQRVKRITEKAFWDSVQSTLAGQNPPTASDDPRSYQGSAQAVVIGRVAGLLAELGSELAAVLPEQAAEARERLLSELDEARLKDVLAAHQVCSV